MFLLASVKITLDMNTSPCNFDKVRAMRSSGMWNLFRDSILICSTVDLDCWAFVVCIGTDIRVANPPLQLNCSFKKFPIRKRAPKIKLPMTTGWPMRNEGPSICIRGHVTISNQLRSSLRSSGIEIRSGSADNFEKSVVYWLAASSQLRGSSGQYL